MPVLAIMLSGLIEFGFALNQFLNILDAAREGARFGADGDPTLRASCTEIPGVDNDGDKIVNDCPDPGLGAGGNGFPDDYIDPNDLNTTCAVTNDYYMQVACVVMQTANPIQFDPALDNVVVSIYRVYDDPLYPPPDNSPKESYILGRLPDYSQEPDLSAHDPISTTQRLYGQWRLFDNDNVSVFSQSDIAARLLDDAPGAGILVVEVFYNYHMVLGLPWITQFVRNPLPLYSYTIIPVPAAEPRPTPTPTPTPTNTFTPTPTATPTLLPTDTSTPANTATPTSTDTPTETPVPTDTPPGCGFIDGDASDGIGSTLTVANSTVWADGAQAATVTVSVFDNCNQPVSGQVVVLNSSRGGFDIITLLSQVGNQTIFIVQSDEVGTSTFDAEINPVSPSPVAVTQTGNATFVCVNGAGSPLSFVPTDVQFGFTNPQNPPAPLTHALRALTITWDDQTDTRRLVSVKMGSTVIWSNAGGVTSPFTINVGDWISPNRTINPGTSRSLTLSLSAPAAGGTYTLNPNMWDDGAGGSQCTAAPVSANR